MDLRMDDYVLVGIPIPNDYLMDARITCTIEEWDRSDKVESYYAASRSPVLGRDRIVRYAQYRVPRPSHILLVDADVLPKRNTLKRLLALDKDIVTGVYQMRRDGELLWCVSRGDDFTGIEMGALPNNPFKIRRCGNGIILVKMEVFDNLEWPYWKDEFAPGVTLVGEDIYFCKKALAAGYDIWCNPKIKCNHIKMTGLLGIANDLVKETKNV